MSDRHWVAEPGMYADIAVILDGLLEDLALRSIAQSARSHLRVAIGAVAFLAPGFSNTNTLFARDAMLAPETFSLCADTMASAQVVAMPDLSADRPQAHDEPGTLRSYAGCSLRGWRGDCVGVLYVMDTKTRRWNTSELSRLRTYSGLVSSRIEIVRRFGIDSLGASSGDLIRRADQLASVGRASEARQLIALAYAAHDIAGMCQRNQDDLRRRFVLPGARPRQPPLGR